MKSLLYVLPLCVFAACGDGATTTAVTDTLPKIGAPIADKLTPSPVDGTWSGSFSQSAEDEALHNKAEDFLRGFAASHASNPYFCTPTVSFAPRNPTPTFLCPS